MSNTTVPMNEFTFPEEIKNLITHITDEKQWKILEFLIQNDNELSYTQIREKLKISEQQKSKLNYHLKELQKAGWLRNWLKKGTETTDRQKSYYSISDFGLKVIEGSMKSMEMSSYDTSAWSQLQETITGTSALNIISSGTTFLIPASVTASTTTMEGISSQRSEISKILKEWVELDITPEEVSDVQAWNVTSFELDKAETPWIIQRKTTIAKRRQIE